MATSFFKPAHEAGHARKIGEQEGDRLGAHRGAPVGVDGESAGHDRLLVSVKGSVMQIRGWRHQ